MTPPPKFTYTDKPPPKPPEPPENPWKKLLPIFYIGVCAIGLLAMIMHSPRMKTLSCPSNLDTHTSLTTFGSCTEE